MVLNFTKDEIPADDFSRGLASLRGFTGLAGAVSDDVVVGAGSGGAVLPLEVPLALVLSTLGVGFSMFLFSLPSSAKTNHRKLDNDEN